MDSISLGDALFTKTQQKVLALLYGKPDNTFYLNEIVRWAEMGKGAIKRELEKMLAAGLVTITHIGNQNHFQANSQSPIYHELTAIVRKTFGIADEIRLALKPLFDQIDVAFIYGSIAKGSSTAKSDIDLMVVSDSVAYVDLMQVLSEAEHKLGRPINPSVYDMKQFKQKWQKDNAFISRVMEQPKLWIKGEEGDIGEFG